MATTCLSAAVVSGTLSRGEAMNTRHYVAHLVLDSATIAARTASSGDMIGGKCSTAKNLRLVLPSIGEDNP